MDEFSKRMFSCPELARGGNLDYQHHQSVGPHDDKEHLERLSQGEDGVESVGGRGGQVWVRVVPPVQVTPNNYLV